MSLIIVKNNYNVTLIDQRIDDDWEYKLNKALKKYPLFVGISSMTGTQIHYGLNIAKIIRENSSSPIVWGGVHPSLLPLQTIENDYVDIVIKGEGEETLLELAHNLEKNKSPDNVNGIAYKKGSKIKMNPDRAFLDLNKLPELPYHLIDVKKYLKNEPAMPFLSSRGCPYNCKFCCNLKYSQRMRRAMSTEKAIDGIKYLYENYKFDRMVFLDENFFIDKKRAEKIADNIDNKFDWEVQGVRLDDVRHIDFFKLRKQGLYQFTAGIESGSQRILDLVNKRITVEEIIRYNKIMSKTGIITTYNFMMGFPTETKEDIFASIDLTLKLIKENPNADITAFYTYVPYPGTKLFDLAVRHGFKAPSDLEGWSNFSRHHSATPWIKDKKELMENLFFTSKFVDGKRINRLFDNKSFKRIPPYLLGFMYRRRWKRHDFKNKIDIKLLKYYIKKKVDLWV